MRTPTAKQYEYLLRLGSGNAIVVATKRDTAPLLGHGWITATAPETGRGYYTWLRITAEGLAALARAVGRYGLPELGPKPSTYNRVCGKCGSGRYRYERVEHDNAEEEK